ncbi:MAG: PH domain-containing protein [Propionibacteriaceae bacterium]
MSLWHPDVRRRILHEEGEVVIDEVRRHWVTRIVPVMIILVSYICFLAMSALGSLWWAGLIVGLIIGVLGFWRLQLEWMDRFVVTNMRVFRVKGVFEQQIATMPLTRILDISMRRPFWGTIFNYGHFTFETAAQDQWLRDVYFVSNPEGRDRIIQRVITRAGARAMATFDPQTMHE